MGWAAKSVRGFGAFLLAWTCVFGGVHFAYKGAISMLPVEIKESGRVVAFHRQQVAGGKAVDAFLAPGGVPDRVAMVSAPLMLADPASAKAMSERAAAEAKAGLGKVDYGAVRLREGYIKVWDAIGTGYSAYIAWSYEASRPNGERSVKGKVAELFGGVEGIGKRKSGGLTPNVDATKWQFAHEILPLSDRDDAKRLVAAFNRREIRMADGRNLAIADMPPAMTDGELGRWIETELTKPWQIKAGADPEAWAATEESKDVASAVFVPPISMPLSQLSILLNLAKALGILWALWGLADGGRGRIGAASVVSVGIVLAAVWLAIPKSAFTPATKGAEIERAASAMVWHGIPIGKVWAKSAALQRVIEERGISTGVDVAQIGLGLGR